MVERDGSVSQSGALWEQVQAAAEEWRTAGYNVIPMKPNGAATGDKQPARKWKPYKTARVPDAEHDKWFWSSYKWQGIAIVAGVAFDGALPVELFEFENREIALAYREAANAAGLGDLLTRLQDGYLDLAPRGGYHILWRCEEVGPTQALACGDEVTGDDGELRRPVLIETRGRSKSRQDEGQGLIVVAPSGGGVHPSGKPWKRLKGGVSTIVQVTLEERAALLALARTFDKRPVEEAPRDLRLPGHDFEERGPTIEELIEPAGWKLDRTDGEVTYWTRPGKNTGTSASLGRVRNGDGAPKLWVFTSSAAPFEQDRGYDKFGVYTMLEHGGDFKKAAKELAAGGYGGASDGGQGKKDKDKSQADKLMEIVNECWELTWWDEGDGEPFAIEQGGPNFARPIRGSDSFRTALSDAYYEKHGKVPSSSSLADVMKTVEGRARRMEPRPLPLRVARQPGVIYIDMGDAAGRCIEITAAGVMVLDRSPVTFRRTKATRPLPEPDSNGDLNELWPFLRIKDVYRPLVKAWIVHAFFPEQSHTILRVTGQHGSGKTWTCRFIAWMIDPAIGAFAGPPSNRRDWISHAIASWVIGQENLSHIDPWLSDAYCRAATGDARRDRKLFTDADVDIQSFLRCIIINDISLGTVRGDLADRLLQFELEEPSGYIEEEQLKEDWKEAYPSILGGLYDLAVKVLKELPKVEKPADGWTRMADFEKVLVAVDRIEEAAGESTSGESVGLTAYREGKSRLSIEVIEGDLVAQCLLRVMAGTPQIPPREELTNTATGWQTTLNSEIQGLLNDDKLPRDKRVWPQTPRGVEGWFRRLAPNMLAAGFRLYREEKATKSKGEPTLWTVKRLKDVQKVEEPESEPPF